MRWMPFLMSSPTGVAPPAGMGAGAAATVPLAAAGGLNICVWQSWLPVAIHTRSHPMNLTVLPPTSPPRRRRKLFPFSAVVSRAAKDQSGSAEAAMMSTCTPSQSGALKGSDMSSGGASTALAESAVGTRFSGPVTESNGLRERIGSAFVACGLTERGAGGTRAMSPGAESCFSSAPRPAPTTCMIPCASKNAARATSARITAQKWRFSSLSMAIDG